MTPEELETARAFVACGPWRWMPGMRAVGRKGCPAAWFRVEEPLQKLGGVWQGAVPDINDPCTRGGILQVARDATGDPDLHVRCVRPYVPSYTDALPYAVYSGRGQRWTDRHNSEAEALLQALQAAPEVTND